MIEQRHRVVSLREKPWSTELRETRRLYERVVDAWDRKDSVQAAGLGDIAASIKKTLPISAVKDFTGNELILNHIERTIKRYEEEQQRPLQSTHGFTYKRLEGMTIDEARALIMYYGLTGEKYTPEEISTTEGLISSVVLKKKVLNAQREIAQSLVSQSHK